MLVDIDDAWSDRMSDAQSLTEEGTQGVPGGLGVTRAAKHELYSVLVRDYRSIQIHPLALHPYIYLVQPPRIVDQFEPCAVFLLKDRSVALDPPVDGGVVHGKASLDHHLFQVSIAERIAKRPTDAKQDDLRLIMAVVGMGETPIASKNGRQALL